jgi:hypothetical protein
MRGETKVNEFIILHILGLLVVDLSSLQVVVGILFTILINFCFDFRISGASLSHILKLNLPTLPESFAMSGCSAWWDQGGFLF